MMSNPLFRFLRHIWLVGAREYRTTAKTRSFRLTLLSVPIALVVTIGAQILMQPPAGQAYVLIDDSGRYADSVNHRFDLIHQRDVLGAVSDYVHRWHLEAFTPPGAVWAGLRRWYSDAEVEAFVAAGGADAALAALKPHIPADATPFNAPAPDYYHIAAPSGVPTTAGPEAFGAAIRPLVRTQVMTPAGKRPLAAAIYIPKAFGPADPRIDVWTGEHQDSDLLSQVREELTGRLRREALVSGGLTPAQATQVLSLEPDFVVTAPPPGKGRGDVLVRSALPMALTYLLLISIITAGTKMLLGVVEERSNKLLESILACISPRELMYGKLLGVVAIGLTTVVFWIACAVGAGYSLHGQMGDILRPALSSLQSPWIGAELVIYFISGYVMLAMILLAVGSSSNSMQDAQGYLQPVIMAIMIPYALMLTSLIHDPDSLLPKIMSWIPVYTPFAMLARLGTGVQLYEVVGTTLVMFAFIVVEVIWLGRMFQDNLLNTSQPSLFKQLFGRGRKSGG